MIDHINWPALVSSVITACFSVFLTSYVSGRREKKKEIIRQEERKQDALKLEVKDLRISLYKIEKELNEWKEKYYLALQELIEVKSELEKTLIQITHIQNHDQLDSKI